MQASVSVARDQSLQVFAKMQWGADLRFLNITSSAALQQNIRVIKISRFGASHGFRRFNRG